MKPIEGVAIVVGGAVIIPTIVTSLFVFVTVSAVIVSLSDIDQQAPAHARTDEASYN